MTLTEFLLHVFVLIDDLYRELAPKRLRRRGPQTTKLKDSEVLTIEIVGEFLSLDKDTGIFTHFTRYHQGEFPALANVHRSTFARQAANLHAIAHQIYKHLANKIAACEYLWIIDSMPIDACKFARAKFCERFKGEAAYGHDHTRRSTMYGFRFHARTTRDGAIIAFDLAPANVADQCMVDQLDPPAGTIGIGDRAYWAPNVKAELAEAGVIFLAPFRNRTNDPDPERSRRLSKPRWIIGTVFGQLTERFNMHRTWAKDLWHLSHRVIRKILGHTVALWINLTLGRDPLDFAGLVSE